MRIATFNINGVNKRLPNLLQWLEAAEPDVVCLQELKADDQAFPQAALAAAGYAEYKPLDPGENEAAFRRNRRIELKLTQR